MVYVTKRQTGIASSIALMITVASCFDVFMNAVDYNWS